MNRLLLTGAGGALLAWSATACTETDHQRAAGDAYGSSYGSSGTMANTVSGAPAVGADMLANPSIVTPNDPGYAYSQPPHARQPLLARRDTSSYPPPTSPATTHL